MSKDAAEWRRRGNECARLRTAEGYTEAIDCYSNGLHSIADLTCSKLRSQLLSCRAHVRVLAGGRESAQAAVDDCRLALIEDPSDAMIYWRAAKASLRLELLEQAKDFCKQGLNLTGNDTKLRELLESIDGEQKAQESEKQLGGDMQCAHTFAFREDGMSDFRQSAIQSFRAAVKSDPQDADAWCGLGVALLQGGDLKEAVVAFVAAVAVNPKHVDAQRNLGDAALQNGDFLVAEKAFREVLRLDPEEASAETYFGLGTCLGRRGDSEEAVTWFQQALASQPSHADSLLGLGIAREAMGDFDGACESLRAAVKAAPRRAAAHHNLGVVLETCASAMEAKGSSPEQLLFEAEVALHTACAMDATNADSQCQLGVVLLREGKVMEAKKAFEAAIEIDTFHHSAIANLGKMQGLCDEMCSIFLPSGKSSGTGKEHGDRSGKTGEEIALECAVDDDIEL